MSERAIHASVAGARLPAGLGGRFYGVMPALVTDVKDPDNQGRVKIKFPWSPETDDGSYEVWARLATLMGGNNRGSWFIPDKEDEVLVAFLHGDPAQPYVLGGLWNGKDSPPETMDGDGNNDKKVLRSRNGVKITLDDNDGQEKFLVETPGGQKITLQDGPSSVAIEDANGNSVKLESGGITIDSGSKVTVNGSQVSVTAGMVQVDAGMAKFSGVVQCDTLIATTVVGTTYTPGAGNIW
ncbi:MAG TPA: phage baseplate assembly protein V [Polyangiaceae bacterium]|nr:phage baseplate assembly protein V [Polyangiaceae bacterium]